MKTKTFFTGGTAVTLGLMALLLTPKIANADMILGTAANFGVLGASTVTNTGATTINGNVGVYPGNAITGLGGITFTGGGTAYLGGAVAQQAQTDATTAYNYLQSLPFTQNLTGQNLGGLTLTAGVYQYNSSAQLTGVLDLNFAGASNENIIFQIGSTLTTASNSSVNIENGNSTDNVFFQVGSSATLGTGTQFAGNILALESITLATGANIMDGRALALNGAVTLDHNTIGGGSRSGVSSVPLPSSLPMMVLVLGGLFGFCRFKRQSKNFALTV